MRCLAILLALPTSFLSSSTVQERGVMPMLTDGPVHWPGTQSPMLKLQRGTRDASGFASWHAVLQGSVEAAGYWITTAQQT